MDQLYQLIEDERRRLMKARSILSCVVICIDESGDRDPTDLPDYTLVIEAARDLLRKSINNLDSVNIKKLIP